MKKKEFLTEAKRKQNLAQLEKSIVESFAKTFNKIKRIDEVFYGDSDGDYEHDKNTGLQAQHYYDKGLEAYKMGDVKKASEFYQLALKTGSWLGWGELDLPPYDSVNENDGEDYEMLSRQAQYGINPYQEQPQVKMPEVGDVIQNVDVTLQDGSTIKRTVKVVSMYPEKGEALVRTDAGGDAIVSIDSLIR